MRILVTGATGFIGAAIVDELLRRGHGVVGLARSEAASARLRRKGLTVRKGDVFAPATVVAGLASVDAVIHTAFDPDLSKFQESCRRDGEFVAAVSEAMVNSGRALVATSATPVTSPAPVSTEDLKANPDYPRSASERCLDFADRGVNASIVRLPMSVHGQGDMALVPALIARARESGFSAMVGEGTNRWPAVHRLDVARLYCDAVEQQRAGARYHGVQDEGIPFREIATRIARRLGVQVKSMEPDEATAHFGWMMWFTQMNAVASSARTQQLTGWRPCEANLLADIDAEHYFSGQAAAAGRG